MGNCVHGIDDRFCALCVAPDASARRQQIERRAAARNPSSAVEREIYEAVYAYEEAKAKLKGRFVPANYTWRAIKQYGAIPTVERIVSRTGETEAYKVLVEMGLKEKSFEAVVLRNKEEFTGKAVAASAARILTR